MSELYYPTHFSLRKEDWGPLSHPTIIHVTVTSSVNFSFFTSKTWRSDKIISKVVLGLILLFLWNFYFCEAFPRPYNGSKDVPWGMWWCQTLTDGMLLIGNKWDRGGGNSAFSHSPHAKSHMQMTECFSPQSGLCWAACITHCPGSVPH